jgi:hypothetical protein
MKLYALNYLSAVAVAEADQLPVTPTRHAVALRVGGSPATVGGSTTSFFATQLLPRAACRAHPLVPIPSRGPSRSQQSAVSGLLSARFASYSLTTSICLSKHLAAEAVNRYACLAEALAKAGAPTRSKLTPVKWSVAAKRATAQRTPCSHVTVFRQESPQR